MNGAGAEGDESGKQKATEQCLDRHGDHRIARNLSFMTKIFMFLAGRGLSLKNLTHENTPGKDVLRVFDGFFLTFGLKAELAEVLFVQLEVPKDFLQIGGIVALRCEGKVHGF